MTTTTTLSILDRMRLLSAFQSLGGAYGGPQREMAEAVITDLLDVGVPSGVSLPPTWTLDRYLEWHADDFATEHLDQVARGLAMQIRDAVQSEEGRPAFGGGCRAFYTAHAWRARGEAAHGGVLVVVHDGGDLSLAQGHPATRAKVCAVLARSGYQLEAVSHWYSVVVKDRPRGDGEGVDLVAELTQVPPGDLMGELMGGECDCFAPGRCEHAAQGAAENAGTWIARFEVFERKAAESESTDIGEVWELLRRARDILDTARGVML